MRATYWSGKWLARVAGMLASGILSLLGASSAQAQVPALLVGRWEMRQISFVAERAVPDSVLHQMDNPQVADLNIALAAGEAKAIVDFRPDGTYQFTLVRAGQTERAEAGSYSVKNNTLVAQSPATPGGSSFDDQLLTRLTRRVLIVTFVVGPELPGVLEEVEYRRANP
jgi:hypothetical protein